MADAEPAVCLEGLCHAYPARGRQPARESLRGLTFEVKPGEVFGVLGPNGGGKTTLFKILATLLTPSSGAARVLGLDASLGAAEIRQGLGVVFQNPSLDPKLTVAENMRHQGHLYGLRGGELERRSAELLERYGLADRAESPAGTLSGGLRRRVELAKALLHGPKLLLLDEPSTGLDPAARQAFWDHLGERRASAGTTVLATTHLMDEADRCDRLAIIDRGRLAALGTPKNLRDSIGGDVISIETPDPPALREAIRGRFAVESVIVDATVRVERARGHAFIPELIEAFPGQIRAVNLGRPTLEDVFIRATGHRFRERPAEEAS